MSQRRSYRSSIRVARQSAEMAWLAPWVAAQRLAALSFSGGHSSSRDRQEIFRMGAEKVSAFSNSWYAMATEAWRIQQTWGQMCLRMAWNPWLQPTSLASASRLFQGRLQAGALGMMAKGMAPVHQRVVANARRLSRQTR